MKNRLSVRKNAGQKPSAQLSGPQLQQAVRTGSMSRREMLRTLGLSGGAAVLAISGLGTGTAYGAIYNEVFPTSPLVLNPFTDLLPIPTPLEPSECRDYPENEKPCYEQHDCDMEAPHQ